MSARRLLHTFDNGQALYLEDAPAARTRIPQLLMDPNLLELFASRATAAPVRHVDTYLTLDPSMHIWSASIIRDAAGQFRAWYHGADRITAAVRNRTALSVNGLDWTGQTDIAGLATTEAFGPVLDEGAGAERFKALLPEQPGSPPRWAAKLMVSSDGLTWRPAAAPVTPAKYGETWSLYKDLEGYAALHRSNVSGYAWTDAQGLRHFNTAKSPFVRTFAHTHSADGHPFAASAPVFSPGSFDDGETQFYSVSNILRRGNLRIGLLNIYREDLIASGAPAGAFGTGYTSLCWSGDGVTWSRFYGGDSHWFDPDPDPAAWDHAIAWGSSLVELGDEVWIYYIGFAAGHLVRTDRELGLVKIKRDRFMSRHAQAQAVHMRTRPQVMPAALAFIEFNVCGSLRVQVTDADGAPFPGFSFAETQVIRGDFLDAPLVSARPVVELAGCTVRLEFDLAGGDLWAYYLY